MAKYEKWLEKDNLILLDGWAREGLSDSQIAQNMGISVTTLHRWKNKYPAIFEVLKNAKESADIKVENALLKKALGYEYEEVKEKYKMGELIERTVNKKVVPGDTSAQIFWLKNRLPDRWREKQEAKKEKKKDISKLYEALMAGDNK